MAPFLKQVEKISEELKTTFDSLLKYENFKAKIHKNIVEKVQKKEVDNFIFKNLEIFRKSLNSISPANLGDRKKERNTIISPNQSIKSTAKFPFQRTNISSKKMIIIF